MPSRSRARHLSASSRLCIRTEGRGLGTLPTGTILVVAVLVPLLPTFPALPLLIPLFLVSLLCVSGETVEVVANTGEASMSQARRAGGTVSPLTEIPLDPSSSARCAQVGRQVNMDSRSSARGTVDGLTDPDRKDLTQISTKSGTLAHRLVAKIVLSLSSECPFLILSSLMLTVHPRQLNHTKLTRRQHKMPRLYTRQRCIDREVAAARQTRPGNSSRLALGNVRSRLQDGLVVQTACGSLLSGSQPLAQSQVSPDHQSERDQSRCPSW